MKNYQAFRSAMTKKLLFEVLLLGIFTITLGLNIAHLIPSFLEAWVVSIVVGLGLIPILQSTWDSIRNRRINVDLLATIALSFSLYAQEWNSALFINLMLASARIFGIYTERRVEQSLESLLDLKPRSARVLRGTQTIKLPLDQVIPGDLVVVDLGEQIPVDGRVHEGSATINQASLTGESLPVLKQQGEQVFSATLVVSGNIIVRTEKTGAQTLFEKMISLVESSQEAKTKMKTIAERFASWYISIMLLLSIGVFLYTGDEKLVLAIVLVVCADEIAIAVPLTYIAAMGAAARRGIIVKSGDFLERVGNITTLIVDKTGTLTLGSLSIKRVESFEGTSLRDVLELSGIMCHRSTHPIARAITEYGNQHHIACTQPDQFEETEGRGMRGFKGGKEILIGSKTYIEERHVTIPEGALAVIHEEEARGRNITLVAYQGTVIGFFALADEIRPGIQNALTKLKTMGVQKIVMLTGDNERVAQDISTVAGITEHHANLLPEQKVSTLENYLGKGEVVAMVGDGVNDAAVLSRADVGIAMGGIGADAAIESADIVLMQDNFTKLVELRDISERARNAARINFLIWGVANSIGLYFVFTGVFDPSRAALYNFATDFFPIINSLRLFRYRP